MVLKFLTLLMFSVMKKGSLPPPTNFFKANGISNSYHSKSRYASKVKSQQEVKVAEPTKVSHMRSTVSEIKMTNRDAWFSAFG